MYCPYCGAPEQNQQFCGECGRRLAAPAPAPAIYNTTNVQVNVGAPVIVSEGKVTVVPAPPASPQTGSEWFRQPLVIILTFILFFPLGLALMWGYAPWRTETKIAVSGIFFPPLWGFLVWKTRWPLLLKVVGVLLIVGAFVGLVDGAGGVTVVVLIMVLIWAFWFALSGSEARGDATAALRERIEATLHACNDLVAEIEGTISLDLLAADSPIRKLYMESLEQRLESDALLVHTADPQKLGVANQKAEAALVGLRTVRQQL